MVWKMLENHIVWKYDKVPYKADPQAKAMIDVQCRRLAMLMRSIELDGAMDRFDIECCVIDCLGKAEYLYYGISEDEFKSIVDMERGNADARKKYREHI